MSEDMRYLLDTIAALREENARLREERDEAMQYLEPAALTDREGAEIHTTLVERARLMSMILSAEMLHQRELKAERDTLREAMEKVANGLTCPVNGHHYCPNCGNDQSDPLAIARAALKGSTNG